MSLVRKKFPFSDMRWKTCVYWRGLSWSTCHVMMIWTSERSEWRWCVSHRTYVVCKQTCRVPVTEMIMPPPTDGWQSIVLGTCLTDWKGRLCCAVTSRESFQLPSRSVKRNFNCHISRMNTYTQLFQNLDSSLDLIAFPCHETVVLLWIERVCV